MKIRYKKHVSLLHRTPPKLIQIILLFLILQGCSVRKMVVNSAFNSIDGFDKIFLEESDLQLVKESLPFTLKMLELMVNQSPDNTKLLLSAAQVYTLYGYGFVYREAEIMRDEDVHEASRLRLRARNFLNRAKQSALEGLEIKYPGFSRDIVSFGIVKNVEVEVVTPHMFDPEGERMHG